MIRKKLRILSKILSIIIDITPDRLYNKYNNSDKRSVKGWE